ncbi:MAG TPA: UDP-N-acetylmuramate dehydrogenase [Alphaproteobacteria bacterium]|jgi:UDP-N-acetylmuramate dehydrogenase|nr:UDP-N-acetylmuramate dehydrogenase [Alphaproteobacteria bacterium]
MMPAGQSQSLIERLPTVRGRYTASADLAKITWFRVGGPADVTFRPLDRDDLVTFLKGRPSDVPVTVIGVGSNLLVRDGGVPGVVIRLGRGFVDIRAEGDEVVSGAAALDLNVARAALDARLTGLEFLSGIPGTIGGAVRMNAGAFGGELSDVLISAEAVDGQGHVHQLTPADLHLTYRHSELPEDWIVTSARLKGHPGDAAAIGARMDEIRATREDSQPVRVRTGGSTFKNPKAPEATGRKAWQLIDAAGCRGLTRGGAMVSEKHCNFLINTGTATAADIEALGEEVRRRVFQNSGVVLEWEIQRIGVPAAGALKPVATEAP